MFPKGHSLNELVCRWEKCFELSRGLKHLLHKKACKCTRTHTHTRAHTHARTHTHTHTPTALVYTHLYPYTFTSLIPVHCAHDCSSVLSQVGRLELVYRLKNKPETVAVLSEKCHLVRDKELCVHRDHVNSFNEVNKELARYFSVGNMQCRNEIRRVNSSSRAFPIVWGRCNGFEFQSSILSCPILRPPLTPHFPYLFYASLFVWFFVILSISFPVVVHLLVFLACALL